MPVGGTATWVRSPANRRLTTCALALGLWLGPLNPDGDIAQGQVKTPQIGVLSWYRASASQEVGVLQALHEKGYVDGKTARIDVRWAEGRSDRARLLATELARANVDVILVIATPAVEPALSATRTIPVVTLSADPIGVGLASSLARPGGNITGVSTNSVALAGKRLELLREILPRVARVAFLASSLDPNGARFVEQTRIAGEKIGVRVQPAFVSGPDGFDEAFSKVLRERVEALIVQPLFDEHRARITELAARHRLPTISDWPSFAEAGGLLAYGANRRDLYRQLAGQVDRILKGAKPADLPMVEPATFELTINLKTAKALGLTIPSTVLARADHVIGP